jgi:hypothetical protein
MTHIIEQQNLYLRTTKQRIVRNLNDIVDEINFETHDDVNMEGSGTTIREMFMKHLDNKGNALFHIMEHTNNSDVYRLLFDESDTEQVDTLLGTIDESLDAMGDWDNAYSHYRYHSHEKVNIVGIQPRGEQSDFWKKHFAGFVKSPIPSVIDTSHLHQPPKVEIIIIVYNLLAVILPMVMVPIKMTVMSQVRLLPKPRLNIQNKSPRQVLGPDSARLSRPAQPAHPAKAPCPD